MFNPLKYFFQKKIGLVLGSGGAKGIAHIAVIEYLLREGIRIDMISGSSIGAVIGAVYCAGCLEEFKFDMLTMKRKELIPLFDPVFPKSGFVQGDRAAESKGRTIDRKVKSWI